MRLLDVARLGIAHHRMFARAVADVPPRQRSARHGTDAGDDEGEPPGAECGDQPGNDDGAERCAKRRTAG
jgi:hypothetical protein